MTALSNNGRGMVARRCEPGGGRRCRVCWITAILAMICWVCVPGRATSGGEIESDGRAAVQSAWLATARGDARLWDVFFVDPQYGWAVGDRGVVWHTQDGGRSWQLQRSGVTCSLRSVFFLDRRMGWAAGGSIEPYTLATSGVLLSTTDGGRHWHCGARQVLPSLRRVRFFDHRRGWAIGCSSELFPSGFLVTEDAGRSWMALPGAQKGGWLAADLLAPSEGALAGWHGRAAVIRPGGQGIEPSGTEPFGLRRVRQMALVPPRYGWLVGDGGLVMMTADLGATWRTSPGQLPQGVAGQFDFRAMAVRGAKAWIAGSPGTRVLYSPDAGQTWELLSTGQNLPINAIWFVDDRCGWAVGELGTILATLDGGRSWHVQRAGGGRAAVLGVFVSPEQVPLGLFARLSGDQGYLGALEVIGRSDLAALRELDAPLAERVHEAVVEVGACSANQAWQFPLADRQLAIAPDQVAAAWDEANDGRGLAELEAYLVRTIRQWRPEVIVTHDVKPGPSGPAAALLAQSVLAAVDRAADPTSHAEQISLGGLGPWRTKRVFGAVDSPSEGAITVNPSQMALRLGKTLGQLAFLPQGLIQPRAAPGQRPRAFRLLRRELEGRDGGRDFFSGIVLNAGGDARRHLASPPPDVLARFRRIAQKRRNGQAILEHLDRLPQRGLELAAQIGDLTQGLEADESAQLTYLLASRYAQTGHWPQAAELLEGLARRQPHHPLARAGMVWLVQYYASAEAAWRIQGPQRVTVQTVSAPALDFSKIEDRLGRAAAVAKQLAAVDPRMAARPEVGFPRAVASRQRGFWADAERYYLLRAKGAAQDSWWLCARGERWLARPEGVPPKPMLRCARAPSKPRLDGQLNDPVWAQAEAAELASRYGSGGMWPAKVMLAYDDGFLYLAVRAVRAPGADYPQTAGPRSYDANLDGRDRVDVLLDLDRDFTTYYRLTVDHRGWTGEACWGDSAWNPTWFVAAGTDGDAWTAEAAVPLDQLTGQYPGSGTVWAVGLQRIVPGVGFQAWSEPAAPAIVPQGFGYLVFQ